jgi:hypothetical protein
MAFLDKFKKKDAAPEEDSLPDWEDRTKQWMRNPKIEEKLEELFVEICAGYDDKKEQTEAIEEAWDCYNCVLNENQSYSGTSSIYIPIIHDAIEARVTRFSNMMFPMSGRYSEVTSVEAEVPYETMALLDHYVEKAELRQRVLPALLRTGDIEGQYSVSVSWKDRHRYTVKKKENPIVEAMGGAVPDLGTIPDVELEKVGDAGPEVTSVDSRDLLVFPASVDNIDDADVVVLAMRMSKGRIQDMIDSEEFDEEAGEALLDEFSSAKRENQANPDKKSLDAAGVKVDAKGSKHALVYKIWTRLKIGGKRRMCLIYMAGDKKILSCKRNPYWSDRIDIISVPALKVAGAFWGKSRVIPVAKSQYAANDAVNMGQDSAQYSLMPITFSNPVSNPRVGTMVLAMGAMWECDPNEVKFQTFPSLWKDAAGLVEMHRTQIMQSLGINPAMIPMGNANKKPTQSQVAQEQQVALESTADVVTIIEQAIFNKVLSFFYELDYQYRTKDVIVRKFGPIGVQAEMQAIPPSQVGSHYTFRWYGTEAMKSTQAIQQMISTLGVFNQTPPDKLNGLTINNAPVLEHMANVVFGPRIGPKVVVDQRHMLGIPPEQENQMLMDGFHVMAQMGDDDPQHMQSHMQAAKMSGDHTGMIRLHITEHQMNMAKKQAAQQQQGQPQQGGGPKPGAQVQAPTGPQQPPGAVRQDAMPLAQQG